MGWYFYVGLVASVGISIFTLPQLITLIKTKNTVYINIPMYIIYLIGCFCFLLGGIFMTAGVTMEQTLSGGVPLVIAQSICGVISSIIFIWKMKNYFTAKKLHISEEEYCKQQVSGGVQ